METITALNREKGITVVLITHHMDEAAKAQRVVVMSGGVIAADGSVKQVEYPDYYSISLTIEGPVVEKEEGYFVEGVVELKTNSEMNTVTKYAKPVIKVTGISE